MTCQPADTLMVLLKNCVTFQGRSWPAVAGPNPVAFSATGPDGHTSSSLEEKSKSVFLL